MLKEYDILWPSWEEETKIRSEMKHRRVSVVWSVIADANEEQSQCPRQRKEELYGIGVE